MATFPSIYIPESKKNLEWCKQYIDAAIDFWRTSRNGYQNNFDSSYNAFNGITRNVAKNFISKRYGKASSQPYISYRLGRTKVKLLIGEFLELPLHKQVSTINREAISKKLKRYNLARAAIGMRNELDAVEKHIGIRPLGNVRIPEPKDPNILDFLNPKTQNELIMQWIIDEKVEKQTLKAQFAINFTDQIVVSECHGVIERDRYGVDTYRAIPPKNAIFVESVNDPLCDRSPFKGEVQLMYAHEVFAKYPELTDKQKEEINALLESSNNPEFSQVQFVNGIPAINVYTIQWKNLKPKYVKESYSKNSTVPYLTDISPRYYEGNQKTIQKEVEKGIYKINTYYHEEIWEGIRIGEEIYIRCGPKQGMIQKEGETGKYIANFNYVNLLFGTVNGVRVSLQDLCFGLDQLYDIVIYQIIEEIKKLKGKIFAYDEAATPAQQTIKDVLYDLAEHSILRYNTSSEGNVSQRNLEGVDRIIQELDLGLSQSFQQLIMLKNDIEKTIDRLTGINEDREGGIKATQTATGALQNLQASRSITNDIFFFAQQYISRTLMTLVENTKTNKKWLRSNQGDILLGTGLASELIRMDEVSFDSYDVYLSDGKREREVRDLALQLFPQEINAGQLRTKDVIEFALAEDINQALAVLGKGWQAVQEVAEKQNQARATEIQQKTEGQRELMREDREDRQGHELQRDAQKIQGEKELAMINKGADGLINAQQNKWQSQNRNQ